VRANVQACWMPTNFGKRWVPPAPGSRPNLTSGTPNTVFLLEAAMRYVLWTQSNNTRT